MDGECTLEILPCSYDLVLSWEGNSNQVKLLSLIKEKIILKCKNGFCVLTVVRRTEKFL